ncbi:tyrosine-protein phosphatase [Agrobacterium rosae]|uniref:tyrosine-protein phosphatase n=1 Tax=Agrobacterium rosae TaxID=1972867 RepID=UPI0019D38E98|nr:tyrosine-protein phosphatase [Agrobacterium rosae]MBN7804992.1 tyrosine-protein phosphatase [Agrobacterium rosae]
MIRSILFRGVLPIAAAPLIFLIYFGVLQLSGNFREVIAGQLYRSSQLTGKQLADYVQANGIKTIINLRGENGKSAWYRNETATAEKLGVQHVDFGMSAYKELNLGRVAQLIQIMRDAPKPILLHCKSGADRTGLAAAIYVNRVAGMDEDTAERQLSIRFGHLGIPYLSSAYAMDRTWEDIESAKTIGNMVSLPAQII